MEVKPMTAETQKVAMDFIVTLCRRFLMTGDLDDINLGLPKAMAAQRAEWDRLGEPVAPLLTPAEREALEAVVKRNQMQIDSANEQFGPKAEGFRDFCVWTATIRALLKRTEPQEKGGAE